MILANVSDIVASEKIPFSTESAAQKITASSATLLGETIVRTKKHLDPAKHMGLTISHQTNLEVKT